MEFAQMTGEPTFLNKVAEVVGQAPHGSRIPCHTHAPRTAGGFFLVEGNSLPLILPCLSLGLQRQQQTSKQMFSAVVACISH
jgi:hypothetical protein